MLFKLGCHHVAERFEFVPEVLQKIVLLGCKSDREVYAESQAASGNAPTWELK